MNPRERTLATVLIGLMVLAVGGAAAYLLVIQPLGQKTDAANKLDAELDTKRAEFAAINKDAPRLAVASKRSLPADPAGARREYHELLSRILHKANVATGYKITEKTPDNAGVPMFSGGGKKATYQKVAFEVSFDRADMWAVKDVLEGYYKLNILHQITHFEVKVDSTPGPAGTKAKATADRRDLAVKFSTEAIILDGAENRRTLLPVPTAFAAAGGWLGYNGVALTPEAGRGLAPVQLAQVLSPKARDYSLLVLKDPFHGPLPPPPPLSLGKMADVAIKANEKLDPIRVPVAGDPAYTGKVTLSATVEGGPFKGTEVKIDDARKTLKLAPKEGETGTGTVTVVAQSATGQKAERTFKVRIDEAAPPPEGSAKEDIANEIVLISVSVASDGTASAIVRDNYNPLTYVLEASSRRVKVIQYEHLGQRKKQNKAYRPDANEFDIDDDGNSGTKRHFKVVAIDDGGLVVEDLKPGAPPKAPDPKVVKGGGPVRGGPPVAVKGAPPKAAPAPSPADGLAALAGPAAVGRPKATEPLLYRWPHGRSLAALTQVPSDEARRILERAAASGPVGAALAPVETPVVPVSSDDPVPAPGN
ncbi:hypothetical protein J0H58_33590 [bacterium]|nr:hypothetical protein [bacterium]